MIIISEMNFWMCCNNTLIPEEEKIINLLPFLGIFQKFQHASVESAQVKFGITSSEDWGRR